MNLILHQNLEKRQTPVLKSAAHLKEEALLALLYSTGLRAGEVIRLKTSDILSGRGQIRVRGGIGKNG